MARIVDFFDGAQSETAPTIGNIIASGIITYPDDATYEASEQGAPVDGNIYYNTTINQLRYYSDGAWSTVIDDDSFQVLVNKTIDADSNTIINLDNDNIRGGAAIDVTKLHDGSVDNAEFGHLDGVTSAIQPQLDGKQDISEKGAANGYAPLGADGKVPLSNLPIDDIDNVDEYADLASFPATGVTDRIYMDASTNSTYRWSGSVYVKVGSSVEQLSDLTDADTTGGVDGQALVLSGGIWGPGDVRNVIQENIALVGKGTAAWALGAAGATNVSVSEYLTSNNNFFLSPNVPAGFTFVPSVDGVFANVALRINGASGNGDGTMTASIYATDVSNVPTGSSLDTSTGVATSALNGTDIENNFIFSGGVSLVAGEEYFIAINHTDTGSIFGKVGVNDPVVVSTNYSASLSPPPDWEASANQNTFYHIARVTTSTAPNTLTLSDNCFVSVPPLADDRHQIDAQAISMTNGQAAYITLDRNTSSATSVAVTVDDITNITPDNNNLIIARCVGNECYFGLHDPQRIADGESPDVQKGVADVFETEFFESIDTALNLVTSPVIDTWYTPAPTWSLTLDPGVYDINIQGVLQGNTGTGRAYGVIALSTSATPGSGILQAAVGAEHDTSQGFNGFDFNFKNIEITVATTFYIQCQISAITGGATLSSLLLRNNLAAAPAAMNGRLCARKVKDV